MAFQAVKTTEIEYFYKKNLTKKKPWTLMSFSWQRDIFAFYSIL